MTSVQNGRSLAEVVAEIKEEVKEFIQTRIQLFKGEYREKLALLKIAAILGAAALLLLLTAYFLITLCLVALVSALLAANPYHWVFGFLAVGILWLILGGIAGYFAYREFTLKGLAPRRTFEVLRGDKVWLQNEARNQI